MTCVDSNVDVEDVLVDVEVDFVHVDDHLDGYD